jgi:hypothetical protein
MPSPTMLELSRWQFAITIVFHMTFPAITVGLSIFLAFVYGLHLRTRKPVYLEIYRFWKRIFAVGFALGVVAGAVITFEFGLDWGPFGSATGPVIGPIIGMEVVTAFFVEAGFIGIMLYGEGRVKERTIFVASCTVAVGTILSTTWIIAANPPGRRRTLRPSGRRAADSDVAHAAGDHRRHPHRHRGPFLVRRRAPATVLGSSRCRSSPRAAARRADRGTGSRHSTARPPRGSATVASHDDRRRHP